MIDNATWLIALPVVLPLLGAGLTLVVVRRPRFQALISVSSLAAVLVIALVLLVAADEGPIVLDVANWAAPVGISLVVDRLAALLLTISSIVTLVVLVYSIAEGAGDDKQIPVAVYHPTFLILCAGVFDAFLAGDLFNLYVAFEMLLVASFALITLGGTRDRVRAGTIYVIVSMISSIIFLAALAIIYAAAGTMNIADLSVKFQEIDPTTLELIHVLLLVAFGIKAAIFPLSAWLPDSYPTAPAPVTAVFAGLLTKVGVYAIIRTETILIPTGRLDAVIAAIAIATMVIGILGAVAQEDLKRLLSFTLVSHIGYMLWGIALGNTLGLGAAIFYTAHHITVQTALFLVAGLMEVRGGTTSLTRLGSLLKAAPVISVLYFIPAMNLSGIPPMTGFIGKVGLLEASVEAGTGWAWAMLAAGLVSSLLTLYAMTKAWNMAFWQEAPAPLPKRRTPVGETLAAGCLVGVTLLLAVLAGPLTQYTQRAAADLTARTPYVEAVFPGMSERGSGQSDAETRRKIEEEGGIPEPTPSPADPVSERPSIPNPRLGDDASATPGPTRTGGER